jgi:hypothetical protein
MVGVSNHDADSAAFDAGRHAIQIGGALAAGAAGTYSCTTVGVASAADNLDGWLNDFATQQALHSSVGTSIVKG